jgi:hypothetical protein
MRTTDGRATKSPSTRKTLRGRRRSGGLIIATCAVIALAATACTLPRKAPLGHELSCAMERDGVLPEGAVWRESGSSRNVCIFGVTDAAAQDLVVEGARESLRRMGRTRFGIVTVEFWSGEPPPPDAVITVKEPYRPGQPPSTEVADGNVRLGISLVRSVRIEDGVADPSR